MRDISKFKNLVNALNMRVRQEYGLVVKLEIHETDEWRYFQNDDFLAYWGSNWGSK